VDVPFAGTFALVDFENILNGNKSVSYFKVFFNPVDLYEEPVRLLGDIGKYIY